MVEPVYDVDGITIYHADNADVVWPDPAAVGLLLTDPPYGIDLETDYSAQGSSPYIGATYPRIVNDGKGFSPAPLLAYRRLVVFGANNFVSLLPDAVAGSWLVWDKVTRNGLGTRGSDAELAWCGGVSTAGMVHVYRHMWKGAFRDSERALSGVHPTQKPVALMRWIVEKWTEPGDLVFDPYMGSGPVARACADLGRRYIGIEVVEEYVGTAIGRLGQTAMVFDG